MTTPTDDSMALTVKEALATLRISRSTFYRMVEAGEIKIAKLRGRTLVRRGDLVELLESATHSPA